MKFDHFGACPMLPVSDRAELSTLKTSCGRRGGSSGEKGSANSTGQYYHDAAVRLGLVDTEYGIRFKDSSSVAASSADISALSGRVGSPSNGTEEQESKEQEAAEGISALVLAATDPDVRAEFDRRRYLNKVSVQI